MSLNWVVPKGVGDWFRYWEFNNIAAHAFIKDADYIIRVNGSCYEAVNGTTGKVDFGGSTDEGGIHGTDAVLVTQAALDALTPARTWKEKVLLKGDFLMNDTLGIPSYTIFELQGKITCDDESTLTATGGQFWWIHNDDPVGGNTQIDIIGGIYDQIDKPADCYGLNLRNTTYASVRNVMTMNTGETGIALEYGSNFCIVENCTAINAGYDGIGVGGFTSINHDDWFVNCTVDKGAGSIPHNAFVVEQENYGMHLINCVAIGPTACGFAIMGSFDNTLTACVASGCGEDGYRIYDVNSKAAYGNTISQCKAIYSQLSGIVIDSTDVDCKNNIISECQANNNNQAVGALADIYIDGSENIIIGCRCHSTTNGILEVVDFGDYNIIALCNTNDAATTGITVVGANTKCNLCWNKGVWIA